MAITILALVMSAGVRLWILMHENAATNRATNELRNELYRASAFVARHLQNRIAPTLQMGAGEWRWHAVFVEGLRPFDASPDDSKGALAMIKRPIFAGYADLEATKNGVNFSHASSAASDPSCGDYPQITLAPAPSDLIISAPGTDLTLLHQIYYYYYAGKNSYRCRTMISAIYSQWGAPELLDIAAAGLAVDFIVEGSDPASYYPPYDRPLAHPITAAAPDQIAIKGGRYEISDTFSISAYYHTLNLAGDSLQMAIWPHFSTAPISVHEIASNITSFNIAQNAQNALKISLCIRHADYKINGAPLILCGEEIAP